MTRTIRLALIAALVVACADHDPTHPLLPADADRAISDGITDGNPHFFFLPPMVEQPSAELLTGFEPAANPVVRIVCEDSNQGGCVGFEPIVFAVGEGVLVEADHYKVDFDTKAYDGLQTSGSEAFTTYRVVVEVSLDIEALGSFTFGLGYADIQLADNGKEAKNITSGVEQVIGLVDGRTLPVRFRIDRGALEVELNAATAAEDEAVCQINCSVTFIDPAEETLATLADPDFGGALATAMLFKEGDVIVPSVLIIDERVAEGEAANCAPGTSLRKKNCYRYLIEPKVVPDVDHRFANGVRFGICPVGVPTGPGTQWGLFRVSGDVVERPKETQVDDFLPCAHAFASAGPWSTLNRLAQAAFDWLVPPLYAGDCGGGDHDCWGGTLRDLSDLFWGLDAELTMVGGPPSGPVLEGTQLPVTVQVMATHSDPHTPLAGFEVVFSITQAAGELGAPVGSVATDPVHATDGRTIGLRLTTDGDGLATVLWTVVGGTNILQAWSPEAITADVVPLTATVLVPETIGTELLLSSFRNGQSDVFVLDADGTGETNLTNHPAGDAQARWSPDGNHVVFASDRDGTADIHRMSRTGTGLVNLTSMQQAAHSPWWSPDGTRIVFQSAGDIFVMNADGSGRTNISNSHAVDFLGSFPWSPDGARILFTSNRDGPVDVFVMNADGSDPVNLTQGEDFHNIPEWSPDGTRIVFHRSLGSGIVEIFVMNADGSGQMNLTNRPESSDFAPHWSPDGSRIAFVSERDGNREIYVMNADGSGTAANLTNHPGSDDTPQWSPDGTRIAFVSDRDGTPALHVMDASGGNVTRITNHSGSDVGARWAPLPIID